MIWTFYKCDKNWAIYDKYNGVKNFLICLVRTNFPSRNVKIHVYEDLCANRFVSGATTHIKVSSTNGTGENSGKFEWKIFSKNWGIWRIFCRYTKINFDVVKRWW